MVMVRQLKNLNKVREMITVHKNVDINCRYVTEGKFQSPA